MSPTLAVSHGKHAFLGLISPSVIAVLRRNRYFCNAESTRPNHPSADPIRPQFAAVPVGTTGTRNGPIAQLVRAADS